MATERAGGIYAGNYVQIVGSTISANSSALAGGILSDYAVIKNSTVVRNAETDLASYGWGAGGVVADEATIVSSIVANNTAVSNEPRDVRTAAGYLTAYTSLIRSASEATVSLTVDPRLGPLADRGGGRRTHALLPGSPVIDLGSNPLHLQFDERGLPRVVGIKLDIGAYERQALDDQLLYDGFDSS